MSTSTTASGLTTDSRAKRVLMIAYYFPPTNNIGAIRPLKFAKYLPSYGWAPYVLSVRKCAGQPLDPDLLQELPESVSLQRTWHLEAETIQRPFLLIWKALWKARLRRLADHLQPYKVTQWLLVPDNRVGWLLPAYKAAMSIIRQQDIDAVYSTSGPVTSHIIGLWIKRSCGLPWIADFRDPWTQNVFNTYPSQAHATLNRRLERQVLRRADAVLGVSGRSTQELSASVPETTPDKFLTIMNGYDEEDFAELRLYSPPGNDRFTVAYIGTLYGFQSARNLLTAVTSLVKDGELDPSNLRVQFIGRDSTGDLERVKEAEWIEIIDHVPHRQALRYMVEADLLILIVYPQGKGVTTGKLFEYLAARRPLLALVPEDSAAAEIVRRTGVGIVVAPEDVGAIRSALLYFYQLHAQGQTWKMPDLDTLSQYERSRQAEQLAQVLNSLTERTI